MSTQETTLDLTRATDTCSETGGNDYQLEMTLQKLLNQSSNEKDLDMDNDVLKGLDLPALLQEDEQDAFIHESMKYAFDEPNGGSDNYDAFDIEDKQTKHDNNTSGHTNNNNNNKNNKNNNNNDNNISDGKAQRKQKAKNLLHNGNKSKESKSTSKDDLLFHTLTPPSSTNSPFPSDTDEFGKLSNINEITSNQLLSSTDKISHSEESNSDDDAIEPCLKTNKKTIKNKNHNENQKTYGTNNSVENNGTDFLDLEQKIIFQLGGANRFGTDENEYDNVVDNVINTELKVTDEQVLTHQLYKKIHSKLVKTQTENKDITNNYAILKDEYIKNCISLKKALLKLKESEMQRMKISADNRVLKQKNFRLEQSQYQMKRKQELQQQSLVAKNGKETTTNIDEPKKEEQAVALVVAEKAAAENSSNEVKNQ